MRKSIGAIVVIAALSLTAVAQARTLPVSVAVKLTKQLAAQQFDKRDIVHQHLSPAHRVSPGRIVFRYNDRARNGQVCQANVVVRFKSRTSNTAVAFFRDINCRVP
jgi:hypothetical protein